MKIAAFIALALLTAGCSHSARFSTPPTATAVQPYKAPSTSGPYTREREDREFGQ